MKTMLVDAGRCLQCLNCQIVCKDEHCDNDWSPTAAPQSPGQFWVKVIDREVASGARVRAVRYPVLCQQCSNPSCKTACEHDAIYTREDGIVIIDPTKCKGCGKCAEACPYGAIYSNSETGISQKCTFCAHLLDAGRDKPRCVDACPNDVLLFVDEADLTEENLKAPLEALAPGAPNDPRVAYMNLPKPFAAGTVVDGQTGDFVQNVRVTLAHQVSGFTTFDYTDFLGDFEIKNLKPGYYTITFYKDGYEYKKLLDYDLRSPLDVGTIKIRKIVE